MELLIGLWLFILGTAYIITEVLGLYIVIGVVLFLIYKFLKKGGLI